MKKLTLEQKKKALSLRLSGETSVKALAAARRKNSAKEFDGDSLIERSERTSDKRAASLLAAAKSLFDEN